MSTRTNDSKDDLDDDSKDDPDDDDPTVLIFAAIVVAYLGFRTKSSTMRSCNMSLVAIPVAIAVYIYLLNDQDIFLKKLQTSLLTPLGMLFSLTWSLFRGDVKKAVKKAAIDEATNVATKKGAKTAGEAAEGAGNFVATVWNNPFFLTRFGNNRVGDWDKFVPSISQEETQLLLWLRKLFRLGRGPQYLKELDTGLDGKLWQVAADPDVWGKFGLTKVLEGVGKAMPYAVTGFQIYQAYMGIDAEQFARLAQFWTTYGIAQSAHKNRETCRQSFNCRDDQTWSDCTASVEPTDKTDENFERCQKIFEEEDDLKNRTAIEDRELVSQLVNDGFEKALALYSPIIIAGGVAFVGVMFPVAAVLKALSLPLLAALPLALLGQTFFNFLISEVLRQVLPKLPGLTGFVGNLSKMYYDFFRSSSSSSSSSSPPPTCKDFSLECEEMPESSGWSDDYDIWRPRWSSELDGMRRYRRNGKKGSTQFHRKCFRALSLKYHPDKVPPKEKDVATKNFNALSDCEENNKLQRRKQNAPPLEQTVAPAVAIAGATGGATAMSLIILGAAAPIALPVAGMTAALTYFAVDREEE